MSAEMQITPVEPANYVAESPWAGLAREEVQEESVEASMRACGLDWTVDKEPVFLKDGRRVPDRMAVVQRPGDRILGTAGKLFTPIQNLAAFGMLQHAIDEYGARVETCGALGGGTRVWMLLRLPEGKVREVAKGDKIKPYFLVSNAHTSERSQSLQGRYTSIRVWCENSLEAAQRADRAAVSIPHHKNAKDRLDEIAKVIDRMYKAHENSMKVYKEMLRVKVKPDEVFAYLRDVFRLRDRNEDLRLSAALSKKSAAETEGRVSKVFDARESVMWLVDNGRGTGRTAWGAYNAVTEYIDHVSILKKGGGLTKNGFETAAFGYGAYQKAQALDFALDRWMGIKKN